MIALYIIGGLVLVILLLVLFAPTSFHLEKKITVNKPKNEVFPYLTSLRNQDKWSVWNMKDPNMKKDMQGTDGTVGAVYSWDSTDKNVGKGAQEIKGIKDGERVDLELRFELPMKATNQAWLTTKTVGNNQTEVAWGFSGKTGRPMNVMSLLMSGMLNKAFAQGLANLKKELEK